MNEIRTYEVLILKIGFSRSIAPTVTISWELICWGIVPIRVGTLPIRTLCVIS